MTVAQITRHVRGYRHNGPNWFERGLLIVALLSGLGAVLTCLGHR